MIVHETAVIYPNVVMGEGAIIEPYAIVGIEDRFHDASDLNIGASAFIGSRCTIYTGVKAGNNFDVSDQTTIFTNNIFGDNVRIGPKAVIKNGCSIGNNVRINAQVFMERVVIENDVFIGPHAVFTNDMHPPCPRNSECVGKTHIEPFVSIGAGVVLAPGIRVSHHTQIYSGSVVVSDIPAYSVVGGNPARVLKDFRELQCKPGLYSRPFIWWD